MNRIATADPDGVSRHDQSDVKFHCASMALSHRAQVKSRTMLRSPQVRQRRKMTLSVKLPGRFTPRQLSALATAGQESGSGQYPVDWFGHLGDVPAVLDRHERDLPGGEDASSARKGDVSTAPGCQPQHAVESNDECEGVRRPPRARARPASRRARQAPARQQRPPSAPAAGQPWMRRKRRRCRSACRCTLSTRPGLGSTMHRRAETRLFTGRRRAPAGGARLRGCRRRVRAVPRSAGSRWTARAPASRCRRRSPTSTRPDWRRRY